MFAIVMKIKEFIKKNAYTILLLLLVSFFSLDIQAAGPPGPPGGGGGPGCWPPPCVPIDGGLSLLLLAGVAYGGKKTYDISKDKKADL